MTFMCIIFLVNSSSKAFNKKYIIFDGVDTFSEIYLNKKLIGSTNNMFVKYTFSVEDFLKVYCIILFLVFLFI